MKTPEELEAIIEKQKKEIQKLKRQKAFALKKMEKIEQSRSIAWRDNLELRKKNKLLSQIYDNDNLENRNLVIENGPYSKKIKFSWNFSVSKKIRDRKIIFGLNFYDRAIFIDFDNENAYQIASSLIALIKDKELENQLSEQLKSKIIQLNPN